MEAEPLFHDGHQHVDRHGDPDLGFDGVLGSSIEGLDAQVLLDPLEEQLDLPARFVESDDDEGWQGEVVC